MLYTPVVNNHMEILQVSHQNYRPTSIGNAIKVQDLLQLIDDDTQPVEAIDKHLYQHTDIELTDDTIVDYLLNVIQSSTESKPEPHLVSVSTPLPESQLKFQQASPKHRICKRTKLLTFTEAQALKRQQKEKREMKKEKFKADSGGQRRSERRRMKVRYF